MRSALRVNVGIALVALCSFAAADGFSIKRAPKVGAAVKYNLDVSFDANGGQGTLKATLLEKVTNIDKDGNFTVEQSQLDASGTFDKEQIEVSTRTPVTLTYKPNGQVTLIAGDLTDANAYRMENLGSLIDPGKLVSVGDLWSTTIKPDKALGTREVRTEFRLVSEEKIGGLDTLRIKGIAKEAEADNPATDEFTVWISKEDGSIVQLESKWQNAPFPGQSSPIPASIKITRVAS